MKKILWVLLVLVLFGAATVYYLYNKPHRDLVEEQASMQLTTEEIFADYEDNAEAAKSKYGDQVIAISGVISEMGDESLILDEVVYCSMDSTVSLSEVGQGASVTVKGRVLTYDELLGEIKLDNCVIEP